MDRRPVSRLAELGPLGVGLVTIVIAAIFVMARFAVAADLDESKFIVAGDSFVDPTTTPVHVHVFEGSGYDGQFYFRQAIDPFEMTLESRHGVRMDQDLRVGRITYPILAWLSSLGRPAAAPWALIGVNVIGLGVVAGLGGLYARDHGRRAWWGLMIAGSTGLTMTLSRDLCEIVMVAGLVGGVVSLGRRRPLIAGACWIAAVLAHEQSLVIVGAYAAFRIVQVVARRIGPGRDDLAWVVPGFAFVAWQVAASFALGHLPILGSGEKNLGPPFHGLALELSRWFRGESPGQEILFVPQLAFVIGLVVVAFTRHRALPERERWLTWALIGSVLLAVSLSENVWKGPAELRTIVIVPTLAWLVVIGARRRVPVALTTVAVVLGVLTAGLRVFAI